MHPWRATALALLLLAVAGLAACGGDSEPVPVTLPGSTSGAGSGGDTCVLDSSTLDNCVLAP